MRHDTGADRGFGRSRRFRIARPHAPAVGRYRAFDPAGVSRDVADGRHPRSVRHPATATRLDRVRAGHAGRALGRLADPAQVLVLARTSRAQHVHADWPWGRACLCVQPCRRADARVVSAGFPGARWCGRHVFRGGGGNRDSGDPGRRPPAARDGTDQSGNSTVAEARAQSRVAPAR